MQSQHHEVVVLLKYFEIILLMDYDGKMEHRKTWANTEQTLKCCRIYVKYDKSPEYSVKNIVSTRVCVAALKAISLAFTQL